MQDWERDDMHETLSQHFLPFSSHPSLVGAGKVIRRHSCMISFWFSFSRALPEAEYP